MDTPRSVAVENRSILNVATPTQGVGEGVRHERLAAVVRARARLLVP
jgi:hypothetical protein